MSQSAWWAKSVDRSPACPRATEREGLSRRRALELIVAVCGLAIIAIPEARAEEPEPHLLRTGTRVESRPLLEMQETYGWSFGAAIETLTFDGASALPFDPPALLHLVEDLRPAGTPHARFYIPTLFQSLTARPRAVPIGDPAVVARLDEALVPIFTPEMDKAYRRGRALAALLLQEEPVGAAVVVDLPGPEAVAFAAGAAEALDPVFLFDNWPHPRGVVPAHLTLAAAAFFQPLFAKHPAPNSAPPMFVLDRNRLNAYVDDDLGFDNRHVARMPSAEALRAMNLAHVLYVTPTAMDLVELDDLNDDFVHYDATGLDVRMLAANEFGPDAADAHAKGLLGSPGNPHAGGRAYEGAGRFHYGGSRDAEHRFWHDYPLSRREGAHPARQQPEVPRPTAQYKPQPRTTLHSQGPGPGPSKPVSEVDSAARSPLRVDLAARGSAAEGKCDDDDPGRACARKRLGHVRVVVSSSSHEVLGADASRSGTWGRATTTGG